MKEVLIIWLLMVFGVVAYCWVELSKFFGRDDDDKGDPQY